MPRKNARARRKSNGNMALLITILCALAICASALFITDYYMDKRRTLNTNAELLKLLAPAETPAAIDTPAPETTLAPDFTPALALPDTPAPTPLILAYPTPPSDIDARFDALYDINPDVIGRLYLPSATTPIELIVVKRDNIHYLNHDFYGAKHDAGTLFLDEINEIWPQDQHMLIYGHNMKNGTMFARLTKYDSPVYAARNPLAYFDTLYESGVYAVFAALRLTEAQSLSEEFNIRTVMFTDSGFMNYINAIRERALYVTNVDMNGDDQLLSLITCSYDADDERFILILRRLRENETEADIRSLARPD